MTVGLHLLHRRTQGGHCSTRPARLDEYCGLNFTLELPTGSGVGVTLMDTARLLSDRLVSLFTRGEGGRRRLW
jgi:hypothetical protein